MNPVIVDGGILHISCILNAKIYIHNVCLHLCNFYN